MAPVDNSPTCNMGNFELICTVKSNDQIPVHKYRSTKTGLTVFIAEVDGPVVGGYLALATEAHDDDGLPHTLEHLIFMGSENYPYKGILDLMANRCLASGTNAATDTDNTFYTMETIGSEGFLTLLPVYIDHVLYPTLKDSAFTTEVHHISEVGEDAGVVYCEMQALENNGECMVDLEMKRAIYPGQCGYKSYTGGSIKNLRESTNNDKCRKYHKDFYRPENLCVIITGQVKHADVFKALQSVEDKIIVKGDRGPFIRPWQSEVPPFDKSVEKDVYYGVHEEDNGIVNIAWRGPSAVTNRFDMIGCTLLMKYMTDTSASPLQKEFVEIEDPYCSNVTFCPIENSITTFYLQFCNVPKAKISQVKDRLVDVLKKFTIDMQRMNTVIHRHILETMSNLERNPHDFMAFAIIGDFLFGKGKEDLEGRLNEIESLKKLQSKSADYWMDLLKRYFIDTPCAVIKGHPSVDKQKELEESEKKRIEAQIERLGPEGLKKKGEELEKAINENETPISDDILTKVPIPSTDSFNSHPIKSFETGSQDQYPRFDCNKLPFYTYLDHVNTNFVYMFMVMDTSEIPVEKRPYLPILLEAILECPILRDGKLIPYEAVVSELEMDTIAVGTRMGLDCRSRFSVGAYGHNAMLILQLELAKYSKGIQWMKELLYQSQLVAERLKIIATKNINDVAQMKRKEKKVIDDLMTSLLYRKESNNFNVNMLRQHQFLTKMVKELNSPSGGKEVLDELELVRSILTSPKNITLMVAVNADKLAAQVPDVYKPWTEIVGPDSFENHNLNIVPDYKLIKPLSEIEIDGCVAGMGSTESAFFLQCCPCINDFEHSDLAPLLVCLQYFIQLEGPMWVKVRGLGLAYGYTIFPRPNEGLLYLQFYRATNPVDSYKETKAIIENMLSTNSWDQLLFESAKSSLIYQIVQEEKSVGDMVAKAIASHFKKVPIDYTARLVKKISAVKIKDLERVLPTYVKPLFDPSKCKTTIVCKPARTTEIAEAFKEMNHDLKIYQSIEDTYMSSW
ncbi:uncharacterized protein C05D11.1 [Copidosoma floridanum]|uniref:uncharacterized protein C05D11.1 n=1 Tax=Copidosoma floridanum TaxID=29053 RepID=UPI0006C98EBF|nr:uncharacterized protein C05D11.1 [Copidosoma floridanum]XP_014204981.1 uncharacterized protein C05D11.1 [Copidosoma floridanum]XP_023245139.1 uncharacterized protein C05D11.1 [Copidosoma floridanum]